MTNKPKSIHEAYKIFTTNKQVSDAEILTFCYPDGVDVYNPTVPFISDGKEVMACRVQERTGRDSTTVFFAKYGDVYKPIPDAPIFPLEDPFVTYVGGEIVLGGVYVTWEETRALSWQTLFYKGPSIYELKHFASGPAHMKDIRLLELPDGRIAVCTRPQGAKMIEEYGCIAKIGFTVIDSLDHLTGDIIENAPYIQDVFPPDEWGGVNQLHALPCGKIGVIGHISHKEHKNGTDYLHYYSVVFVINPANLSTTPVKVICSRDCFPGIESREPRLYDVTFCAGIIENNDGFAHIYTGLSDCQIGRARIHNPFKYIANDF
ncbi:MAG: DUF1861 family protein [Defluviitaleaceae bacterium]|nr:DUF1861 family protein [Defluviitaleaceae bacterium]